MNPILDSFLVGGAIFLAAGYLVVVWYLRRGVGSCCDDGKKKDRNDRLQIRIPKKSDR